MRGRVEATTSKEVSVLMNLSSCRNLMLIFFNFSLHLVDVGKKLLLGKILG